MHDNAPVHRAHIVKEILKGLQIQVMIWPPYSSDLNPIENLWGVMKQELKGELLLCNRQHANSTSKHQHLLFISGPPSPEK